MNGSAPYRLCPVSASIYSAASPACAGNDRSPAAISCVQTNTAETEVTNHRSDLLDHDSAAMVQLGRRADFGQTRDGGLLASGRLSIVLASAVQYSRARKTENQCRNQNLDPTYESGETEMGSSSHSRRTTQTGISDLPAHSFAV